MIKITFYTHNNNYVKLVSKGHADYNKHGEDIVCSAISAVTQSLALGVIKVLGLKANYKTDEKKGYLELRLPEINDEMILQKTQVLFETCLETVKDFEKGYPLNIEVEVKRL